MPFLETLNSKYGVGPVCYELDIAPSTYYWHRTRQAHPDKRSQRSRDDEQLKHEIQRVYDENYSVYGVRKVWHQLQREGFSVARCTIERLMKAMGLSECSGVKSAYDSQPESINGLYKAEVIHRQSWKNRSEVELATLTWVDWYNNRRLPGRLGHIPPVEAEKAYYASIGNGAMAA